MSIHCLLVILSVRDANAILEAINDKRSARNGDEVYGTGRVHYSTSHLERFHLNISSLQSFTIFVNVILQSLLAEVLVSLVTQNDLLDFIFWEAEATRSFEDKHR